MLPLIPLFPLIGFLVNAALGRRLPKNVSGLVATGAMGLSFGVSVAAVWRLLQLEPVGGARAFEDTVYTWIASGGLEIPLTFRLDPLSALMILIVTGIGALIHLYSTAYMQDETDGEYARYFSYLNLFAAFMLVLVLGANFPVMFIGWEGVGLCSYLLIGFWFTKPSAADAGKKAFVVNRIGDFGFLLGMLWLFAQFGTLDFQAIAAAVSSTEVATATLTGITLLLFLGATGKSAQIPLFVWLPDAMEGPTPVSALIHAATMVTAGVYMIGRNAVLFSHAPMTLDVVAVVGCVTALMAGTIGLVQNDIKRVLAYSTVSQLGYMFLAMGVGAFAGGIFHLYTHAFFKALLFLGAGAVIHALAGEQDLRNMGGLKNALPVTYRTFLAGTLAIAGVPLLSGFFSKDEILWKTYSSGHTVLWLVAVVTAFLTATYMFRLLYLAFFGERRTPAHAAAHGHHGAHGHLHDAPPAMAIVLVVLAIGSVAAGWIGIPHAIGGGNQIEAFLEPSFRAPGEGAGAAHAEAAETHGGAGTEISLMLVSTLVAFAGIGVATIFFLRQPERADRLAASAGGLHRLLLNKYYVDEIYDAMFVQPIKRTSQKLLWRGVDAGLIDGTVNAVGLVVRGWSAVLRRLQTGSVRAYAMSLFLGVVVILGYYLWR
ncbi:MAG TPA: NADH-quinone oxidoreductase subunit L [Vicinamibacterales bacterium]|nr:NADH-quinone oxidoreductase subunit L [Vicinamibacterales bacterium]